MYSNNRLRVQVKAEMKIRRYVFYTLILLSFAYIGINLLFSDMGVLRYVELRDKKVALQEELNHINEENAVLKASVESYGKDNFLIEKHAREDFGLAEPDEYIFIFK